MIKIYNCDCFDLIQSQDFIDFSSNRKVILVTDPPFNIGYHYEKYKDNLDEEEYYEMLQTLYDSYNFIGGVFIHYPESLYKLSFQLGLFPEKVISWCYNSNTPRQHRDIAFFKIKPNMEQVKQPYKNLNDKRIQERLSNGIEGANLYDWWEINQIKNVSEEKTQHPCQMPLEVMKRVVGILPKDAIIFDPFLGSGTTAVACKELGYDFIGSEIDELYFKIAQDRINGITKTGQTSLDLFSQERIDVE